MKTIKIIWPLLVLVGALAFGVVSTAVRSADQPAPRMGACIHDGRVSSRNAVIRVNGENYRCSNGVWVPINPAAKKIANK